MPWKKEKLFSKLLPCLMVNRTNGKTFQQLDLGLSTHLHVDASFDICFNIWVLYKCYLPTLSVFQRASSSEEVCLQTLRDTQVLFTKTSHNWDWDLIEYVLKVHLITPTPLLYTNEKRLERVYLWHFFVVCWLVIWSVSWFM